MEFKQLEAFVAVVDYGSFSEAARRLYLTQPTISTHIRSLEEELHSRLILRTTKKTTVTTRGYQLYDSAVRMLEIRNNLLENFTGSHDRSRRLHDPFFLSAARTARRFWNFSSGHLFSFAPDRQRGGHPSCSGRYCRPCPCRTEYRR